jgi:hypothetical protein
VTRSRPSILVLLAILGGAAGWFLEVARVASGAPIIVPPYTLAVALGLIGVIIVLYAIPVWRVVSGTAKKPVDPFYATRVVLLAKASSITGALLGGVAGGIVVFLLSRSVIAAVGSVSMAAFTTLGAAVLLAGGLIAEKMCTLPPDDDQKQEPPPVVPRPQP